MTLGFVMAAVLLLAFANGANDNAKGVATLIGSRTMRLRPAIIFAAVTTMLGSVAAILLAGELVSRFSGKGIVDDVLLASAAFPVSVGIGAAVTVLIATFVGMPISTTHAMVGSIIGVGFAAGQLQWASVWSKLFVPLLASPVVALVLAAVVYILFHGARRTVGVTRRTCVCIEQTYHPVSLSSDGVMMVEANGVKLAVDDAAACEERYDGVIAGVKAQSVVDTAHMMTAGALSFARGLNDTPKIAAIMIAAAAVLPAFHVHASTALIVTGVGIALGGLLAFRRVAQTMSYRITGMNDGQGFTANLVTAFLVIVASKWGMPVSTTHVSCGSLFGIGAVNGRAHWKMIAAVLLAWVTTLPVAAFTAYLAWTLIA